MDEPSTHDLVGQTLLGKLRVVRRIGGGATSVVYEVLHVLTKHRRALKVLRPELARDGEAVARLVREAGVAGRLKSPYLPETFDVGRLSDGSPYVLMELCEGESLRSVLDREGRLAAEEASRIVVGACEALAAVHAAGVVHRDLKPDNLYLSVPGREVKLLDFGMMKPGSADTFGQLTAEGVLAGTPCYMAPEQVAGSAAVDARADVWALGVLLFEAISGRLPFQAEAAPALVRAIAVETPPSLAGLGLAVAPELAAAVDRALRKDPNERFPDVGALRDALLPHLAAAGAARTGAAAAGPLAGSPALAERFEVVRTIKAGGMGTVYEVVHKETQRRRALKLMLPSVLESEELRARFRLEARVTAAIDSEHVVETFDAGVDPVSGVPFLVMELLRGQEIGRLVAAEGPLCPELVVTYLAQVAHALEKTHAAGVLHRDLKPENLFLTFRDDGTPRVKILDFGIAKVIAEGAATGAATQGALGTPLYMAPEQFEHAIEVGPTVDTYALGQIAFTLLVGRPYFAEEAKAGAAALFAKVIAGPRESASARAARAGREVPAGFDAWFARAAAARPECRFSGAAAAVAALASALDVAVPAWLEGVTHAPSLARRPPEPSLDGDSPAEGDAAAATLSAVTGSAESRRRSVRRAGGAALAVGLSLAATLVVLRRGGGESPASAGADGSASGAALVPSRPGPGDPALALSAGAGSAGPAAAPPASAEPASPSTSAAPTAGAAAATGSRAAPKATASTRAVVASKPSPSATPSGKKRDSVF